MDCPRCNTPLEESAVFCGHCGALLKPRLGADAATISELPHSATSHQSSSTQPATAHNQSDAQSTVYTNRDSLSALPNVQYQQHAQLNNRTPADPLRSISPVQLSVQSSGRRGRKLFIALLLVVIIVGVVIASALLFIAPTTATGQVSFFDSQSSIAGNTDALKISISGLNTPPTGSHYDAWLFDTNNEQILSLGTFSKNDTGFLLANNQPGTNLIGKGNKIEITQEQGTVNTPSGKIILSATFPPLAFVHIRHLLASFPTTPGQIGLLVGLLHETQKLNTQASLLQNNLGNDKQQTRKCLAQSIIDIIEGTNGTHYSPLPYSCTAQNIMETGDGFGLLDPSATATSHGYIATVSAHATLAANQTDSTDLIRNQAKKVEVSTENMKTLVQQINTDALQLLANSSNTSQAAEIISRSDRVYHGVDQNGDGKIEPIMGEAGAMTAYTNGQLMASLTLS